MEAYTYAEAEQYILGIPKFSKKTTKENLLHLMGKLGNPQDQIPAIHVAGTNGKGSVCAFTASILKEAKYKVGFFTSPHLIKMNERIKINGTMISDSTFLEMFLEVKKQVDEMKKEGYEHPSFFEFIFAMAALCFAREKVDVAVFEVGLGGRLDATNILKKPAVSVITSISLDHTEILGDTIEKIAAEKAGIMKQGVPLVYLDKKQEVREVFEREWKKTGNLACEMHAVSKDFFKILKIHEDCIDFLVCNGYYDKCVFSVPFLAQYQCENARLAIAVIEQWNQRLREEGKDLISEQIVRDGLQHTLWEGRMEQIEKDIFFDGGHNEDGIRAFVEAAEKIAKGQKIVLLFAAVREKNYEKMIKNICDNLQISDIIITDIPGARCLEMQEMKRCFQQCSCAEIYLEEDHRKAFELGQKIRQNKKMFCVGSLYLIGSLKEIIAEKGIEQ